MKALWQASRVFLKRYKKEYLIYLTLNLISTITFLINPYILRLIIDHIAEQTLTRDRLIVLLGSMMGITLLKYFSNASMSYYIWGTANKVERDVQNDLIHKILNSGALFFQTFSRGELFTRTTTDALHMNTLLGQGVFNVFGATIELTATYAIMFLTIDPKLTLLASLPLPFIFLYIVKEGKMVEERSTAVSESTDAMNGRLLEYIEGVRVVRTFQMETKTNQDFKQVIEDNSQKSMALNQITLGFWSIFRLGIGIGFFIALLYGSRLIQAGQLTIGALTSFQLYFFGLIWPFIMISDLVGIFKRGNISWQRIDAALTHDDQITIPSKHNRNEVPTFESLSLEDYSFTYPNDTYESLKSIDFQIHAGQTIGIVGRTGSGKTTLIRQLLARFPMEESPKLNQKDYPNWTLEDIRSQFSYVPQEQALLSDTIRVNLLVGNPDASDEELMQAVKQADFEKDLAEMPKGLDTLVGEQGITLSGGQRQRIAIARALLRKRPILILDDALSAVDGSTEQAILKSLNQLDQQTMIIIAHRLSAVHQADYIYVLDEGQIVEAGTHDELMAQNGWYQTQFKTQQLEHGGMTHA